MFGRPIVALPLLTTWGTNKTRFEIKRTRTLQQGSDGFLLGGCVFAAGQDVPREGLAFEPGDREQNRTCH